MILMGDKFTVRFLMSGLPAERIKFGFFKDYAIRGISAFTLSPLVLEGFCPHSLLFYLYLCCFEAFDSLRCVFSPFLLSSFFYKIIQSLLLVIV